MPLIDQDTNNQGLGAQFELVRDSKDCRQTAMLQLHGRDDDVMPIAGGVAGACGAWLVTSWRKLLELVYPCKYMHRPFFGKRCAQQKLNRILQARHNPMTIQHYLAASSPLDLPLSRPTTFGHFRFRQQVDLRAPE